MQVMTTMNSAAWVSADPGRREDILPAKLECRLRALSCKGIRQFDRTNAVCQILHVESAGDFDLVTQAVDRRLREHRPAILVSFGFANCQFRPTEVDVLHTRSQCFEQTQAGTIQKQSNQTVYAFQFVENTACLATGQHDRETLGAFGANNPLDAVQRFFQHMLIQEQQGGERLVLCR